MAAEAAYTTNPIRRFTSSNCCWGDLLGFLGAAAQRLQMLAVRRTSSYRSERLQQRDDALAQFLLEGSVHLPFVLRPSISVTDCPDAYE